MFYLFLYLALLVTVGTVIQIRAYRRGRKEFEDLMSQLRIMTSLIGNIDSIMDIKGKKNAGDDKSD